ncbi:hypothetical protein [Salinarimonas soli]|uniref:Uncharacterized protein n=1 Tax=Salinarimonas soli TaxID=1638099 RepID=A0A5B2VHQ5_9HYPH|nr:hypothetical protein [Salinarimonas soli]KAA2238076.1 hypothetical protein F0L46_07355 [Salinarimonas soli]
MISVLLEQGRERPSTGVTVAMLTMTGYALVASIAAGAASPGAGLAVLAFGLFAGTIADFVLWREMVGNAPATIEAEADQPLAALPAPEPEALTLTRSQTAVPA